MVRGGARSRSGPAPDPQSARSDARGLAADVTVLSSKGYKHKPRAFPLGEWVIYEVWKDEDGNLRKTRDDTATERWRAREETVWKELWKTPQAIAWHMPQFAYLFSTVALYVRQFVICESSDAKAADRATLARYADIIGLTPQGLRLNNWSIIDDEAKPVQSNSAKVISFKSAKDRYMEMKKS